MIRCSDSNYDGGAYFLSRYSPEDNGIVCLDRNIRVDTTSHDEAGGLGVFAKRSLGKDAVITSTPLVPVMRKEMKFFDPDPDPVNDQQLMLNYLFGHPDSDLLLLPIGPMVNFINHDRQRPNAEIRWHKVKEDHQAEGALQRRQEYHHEELFEISGEAVALVHGRGLMMDIVATRDIVEGEEIVLDYGAEWQAAWDKHKEDYQRQQYNMPAEHMQYMSAERYRAMHGEEPYRVMYEQSAKPYPDNLKFYCFYDQLEEEDPDIGGQEDAYRKKLSSSSRGFRQFSWDVHEDHPCFRPCQIVERYDREEDDEPRYTVEMFRLDNPFVMYYCSISMDYRVTDVHHSDIKLLDKPYTPDLFLPWAFRHEIGVPEGFYPESWKRKKLRQRTSIDAEGLGEEFKKKQSNPTPKEGALAAAA